MAGALSGHLIDQHHPNNPFNSSIATHGAMSFNPNMHGTPYAQQSFSFFGSQQSFANDSIAEETSRKIATLQVKLDQKLGPEYISQRPGPGGGPKLTYVEGWKIINLANEVFGFNGWSSSIVNLTTDFADYSEETRRYSVGVTAVMRVTLRDGVFHEDVGYGMLENSKSKGAALDKCKKEAVTDGLKRALRNFGNVLGNCLYDKSYTSEVIKIKFEPTKLKKDELHRRPEFEDVKPDISSTSMSGSSTSTANYAPPRPGHTNHSNTNTPTRPSMQQNQARAPTSLPPHMRSEMHASSSGLGSNSTAHNAANQSLNRSPAYSNQQSTGLNTPIITPLHPPAQRLVMPPQPQQQDRVDRRVSFSEAHQPPAVSKPQPAQAKPEPDDEDDSFGFNSDDDAFLAMADLGPAIGAGDSDMGRPIVSDTDMGRPIDHEEGLLKRPDDGDDTPSGSTSNAAKPTPPSSKDSNAAKSRHELIAAALGASSTENSADSGNGSDNNPSKQSRPTAPNSGLATGMLSKHLPQNQSRPNGTSNASSSSSSSMRPPPQPPQLRATSLVQQNHQRYMNQKHNQNQNQAPAQQNIQQGTSTMTTTTAAGEDAVKRAPTLSSMGSFNFPSHVNPLQPGGNAAPAMSSSVAGVKRPAEALGSSGSNSNFRGGRPGMGLQQAAPGSGSGGNGRSILGTLEMTDGGDVKRRRT